LLPSSRYGRIGVEFWSLQWDVTKILLKTN
jgi:hypothetical protein